MFESLSDRLSGVFDRLTKQGALNDDDVRTALREVRVALLEADVSLPVARDFVRLGARGRHRPGDHQIGHAGPAGGQDRP
jgi:signal recognition particle GTPase